jgi:hypothetical protein
MNQMKMSTWHILEWKESKGKREREREREHGLG